MYCLTFLFSVIVSISSFADALPILSSRSLEQVPCSGPVNSPLIIVDFFDYQCGFCRKMNEVLEKFCQENPSAKVIYRPFPLMGAESKILAQAALSAHKQGKFQPMHRWLMTEGYHCDEEDIIEQAVLFGMNPIQFQIDLKSPQTEQSIDNTIELALKNNIRTVPALIINGTVFRELMDYNELVHAIQSNLMHNKPELAF